jgi:hypothetical protein
MPRRASIPVKWLVIALAGLTALLAVIWLDVAWTSRRAENANPPVTATDKDAAP